MNRFKTMLYTLFHLISYSVKCVRILSKGQSEEFEIMMLSHRLEKGQVHSNPKPFWGWEKAERLAYLLQANRSSIAYQTGLAVLNSYLENKSQNSMEENKVEDFRKNHQIDSSSVCGGIVLLPQNEICNLNVPEIEKLFLTRHSTREFSDTPLDKEKLEKAISLAMRCPSACNRQPYKIYYLDAQQRKELLNFTDRTAASLYITGDINAFQMPEVLDWMISPSIFAGYLTLALHTYGIGSCIFRKVLIFPDKYNENVRNVCSIPNNEQIILELRIGNYLEETVAACSNRFTAKQIIKYI